jgi:hypothetical protein
MLTLAWSCLVFRRRPNKAGIVESRLGAEVWGGGIGASTTLSVEYRELDELWAPLSRLSFPRRLKMVLPKICTLSGRVWEGMLLDVERPEDFLERALPSNACSHEGRSAEVSDRSEDEPEELVWWLWCLSRADARLACWLSSRRLSGDGGPSTAGSRSPSMERPSCEAASADDVTGLTGGGAVSLWGLWRPRILDFLEPDLGGLELFGRGSRSTRYTGMLEAA